MADSEDVHNQPDASAPEDDVSSVGKEAEAPEVTVTDVADSSTENVHLKGSDVTVDNVAEEEAGGGNFQGAEGGDFQEAEVEVLQEVEESDLQEAEGLPRGGDDELGGGETGDGRGDGDGDVVFDAAEVEEDVRLEGGESTGYAEELEGESGVAEEDTVEKLSEQADGDEHVVDEHGDDKQGDDEQRGDEQRGDEQDGDDEEIEEVLERDTESEVEDVEESVSQEKLKSVEEFDKLNEIEEVIEEESETETDDEIEERLERDDRFSKELYEIVVVDGEGGVVSGDGTEPAQFALRTAVDADEFTLDVLFDVNRMITANAASVEVQTWLSNEACRMPGKRRRRTSKHTPLDREQVYARRRHLESVRGGLQRTNTALQRRLFEHFKRRGKTSVYVTNEIVSTELALRYANLLNAFEKAQQSATEVRAQTNESLEELNAVHAQADEDMRSTLDGLLATERELGTGLTESGTGRALTEKALSKLLSQQENRVNQMVAARILFCTQRDRVAHKEAQILEHEHLGEGVCLRDYEQLRIENQNLTDKMDERDDECARLRRRTKQQYTALMHLQERSAALHCKLDLRTEELRKREETLVLLRAELYKQKATRDRLRACVVREKKAAGMLANPQLLRDFEATLELRDELSAQLDALRATAKAELRELRDLREAADRDAAGVTRAGPGHTLREELERRREAARKAREGSKEDLTLSKEEEVFQLRWRSELKLPNGLNHRPCARQR